MKVSGLVIVGILGTHTDEIVLVGASGDGFVKLVFHFVKFRNVLGTIPERLCIKHYENRSLTSGAKVTHISGSINDDGFIPAVLDVVRKVPNVDILADSGIHKEVIEECLDA